MTLPIDAIVPIYYSGSVNISSTNSQSLTPNLTPTLLLQYSPNLKGKDIRFWQRFDNIFRIPGLTEVVSIYEKLFAVRQRTMTMTETTSITESFLRRASPHILEIIQSKGVVAITNGLGDGSYVQLNSIQSFVSQVSIVAWVKFINCDHSHHGGIISFLNGYVNNRLLLSEDAQTIVFEITTLANGTVDCTYTLPTTVFSNVWHHFAAVYDGSKMQLYLDGAAVGSSVSQVGVLLSGNTKTQIGAGAANSLFMHGNVAELALYNTPLTAAQILNVYNNGANTVTTGQVNYYKLNEGSGTTAHDSKGTINGTLINGPVWSTDLHSPIPNPSIYNTFISETLTRLKSVVRTIAETISIAEAILRLPRPFLRENIFFADLISRLVVRKTSDLINITEGSGFTSGFTGGFQQIPGLLRKVIPKIATESKAISETLLRKVIPKIVAETITISELLKFVKGRFFTLTETISISESKLRKIIPKVATQTTSISETQLRKPIPKIATEIKSISDSLLRKPIPKITTETISIVESKLRKVIPSISTQTTIISESITRLGKHFRTPTDTISIIETQLRKIVPKIASQIISITESQLRKPIPKISSQSTIISESLLRKVKRFISETIAISDAVSRIAKHFRTASDVVAIVETQLRRIMPKITTQTTAINDAVTKLRLVPRSLIETSAISEALSRIAKHFRTELETISVSESIKRKLTPKIATQITSIVESPLRKVIPKIQDQLIVPISDKVKRIPIPYLNQTTAISELLSVHRLRLKAITETAITISDSLLRRIPKKFTESITITESRLRKVIPKVSTQSSAISESLTKQRLVLRPIAELLISISESRLRKVIPKISTQSTTISEVLHGYKYLKILLTESTILISEVLLRRPKKSLSETSAITESLLRRPKPKITSETIPVSESISRLAKFKRALTETITIIQSIIANKINNNIPRFISISLTELPVVISELVLGLTSGPSWRWRFNPFRKSSFTNKFTPDMLQKDNNAQQE